MDCLKKFSPRQYWGNEWDRIFLFLIFVSKKSFLKILLQKICGLGILRSKTTLEALFERILKQTAQKTQDGQYNTYHHNIFSFEELRILKGTLPKK